MMERKTKIILGSLCVLIFSGILLAAWHIDLNRDEIMRERDMRIMEKRFQR